MADNKRYKPIMDHLDNYYLLGRARAPQTVVEAKRLLADYIMPQRSVGGNVKREDNDARVALKERAMLRMRKKGYYL